MLQWAWECRYLFDILFSFPLDKYPQVGLLDHMIVLLLMFLRKLLTVFHSSCTSLPIYILASSTQVFPFLHSLGRICYLVFLIIAILTGMLCISLSFWFAFRWWLVISLVIYNKAIVACHLSYPFYLFIRILPRQLWHFYLMKTDHFSKHSDHPLWEY